MDKPVTLCAFGDPFLRDRLFSPIDWQRLQSVARPVDWVATSTAALTRPDLGDVEVLITGWGAPRIDAEVLRAMPRLRAILHAAGTVKHVVGDEVWRRGIAVSSAARANAEPVAQYTLAMIALSLKQVWQIARAYRLSGKDLDLAAFSDMGAMDKTIGIVGASHIGRRVIELLAVAVPDNRILLHDPTLTIAEANAMGAELVGLESLLEQSDAISIHAPLLPTTVNLIGARQFSLIRAGATFLNTARAPIVDQSAMVDWLARGRHFAVLDLTDPEYLPLGHPLLEMPNVIVTPHIAGSLGTELRRLGRATLGELSRLANGETLRFAVTQDMLALVA